MTHAIPYDSFEDAELLKKAGYTELQIKTEVFRTKKRNEEISKVIDDSLATKHDVELVRADIALTQKDISALNRLGYFTCCLIVIGLPWLGYFLKN